MKEINKKRERITENMVDKEIKKRRERKQEIDQVGKQSGLKNGGGVEMAKCSAVLFNRIEEGEIPKQ